jgi:hypothetical protein
MARFLTPESNISIRELHTIDPAQFPTFGAVTETAQGYPALARP